MKELGASAIQSLQRCTRVLVEIWVVPWMMMDLIPVEAELVLRLRRLSKLLISSNLGGCFHPTVIIL